VFKGLGFRELEGGLHLYDVTRLRDEEEERIIEAVRDAHDHHGKPYQDEDLDPVGLVRCVCEAGQQQDRGEGSGVGRHLSQAEQRVWGLGFRV
jgi:hypothetical protein